MLLPCRRTPCLVAATGVACVAWAALLVALLAEVASGEGAAGAGTGGGGGMAAGGGEASSSNVWVVLVGSSRNWLNYRDNTNTLALYRSVRDLGVSDERIILMLADNMPCNPRNPHPGRVFHSPDHRLNLYGEHVEVDYRGAEVTVDAFLRLLTGRHNPSVPRSKRLLSDGSSRILIYMTGHGGDKFLKFQDKEELQAQDLADAFHHMHQQQRYHSILLMIDTCQAQTLFSEIYSPGIVSVASSAKGEMSYSYLPDVDLGVSVVDRFTFHTLHFLHQINARSNASLASLFESYDPAFLMSTPGYSSVSFPAPLHQVPVTDYVASVMPVQITPAPYPLPSTDIPPSKPSGGARVGGGEGCTAKGGSDGCGEERGEGGGCEEGNQRDGNERGEGRGRKEDSAVLHFGKHKPKVVSTSSSQVGTWALVGLSVLTLAGAAWGPWHTVGI
ncbi:hypothetical protein CLOM_g21063 [Closterium sp. NIES-68]|nr:hypothetical protein CLOM_g21063 [Closterium sp. NIES-68]GJP62572.1 hypothetical protein CLOP_g19619 [Closterium sp. NIES-67]